MGLAGSCHVHVAQIHQSGEAHFTGILKQFMLIFLHVTGLVARHRATAPCDDLPCGTEILHGEGTELQGTSRKPSHGVTKRYEKLFCGQLSASVGPQLWFHTEAVEVRA